MYGCWYDGGAVDIEVLVFIVAVVVVVVVVVLVVELIVFINNHCSPI